MTRLKLTSLHQLLLLIPLLCGLHACREPPALIYDPNHLIDVQVGADHYLIPLQNWVKPNTGSPSHIVSDNGNAYFFWSSGRGLNNQDIDPARLETDADLVKLTW